MNYRKEKASPASLNHSTMNLPEDNTKVECINIGFECRVTVNKSMEIRSGSTLFYQCFECCQRGFAFLH